MSIKMTGIRGLDRPVTKALTQFGSSFSLEDFTGDVIERKPVNPQLLTTLLTGVEQTRYMDSTTFLFDAMTHTNALPTGKQFTGYGDRVEKDTPETYRLAIPSFGISGNVAVQDYANKRRVGTRDEFDTEAEHLIRLENKLAGSWDLFNEKQLLSLLINDANDVEGGPFTSYDYWTMMVSSTPRTVTGVFKEANGTDVAEPFDILRAARRDLQVEMAKAGEMLSEYVCICGSNFFQAALDAERATSIVVALASGYQFLPNITSEIDAGQNFVVENFKSTNCGITFVEYPVSIDSVGISADNAYLIPVRADSFILKGFAPANTREYVNTTALSHYAWVDVDDREGITRWEESNYLLAMANPRLKVALKVKKSS